MDILRPRIAALTAERYLRTLFKTRYCDGKIGGSVSKHETSGRAAGVAIDAIARDRAETQVLPFQILAASEVNRNTPRDGPGDLC
jgi:hypothetical protein